MKCWTQVAEGDDDASERILSSRGYRVEESQNHTHTIVAITFNFISNTEHYSQRLLTGDIRPQPPQFEDG